MVDRKIHGRLTENVIARSWVLLIFLVACAPVVNVAAGVAEIDTLTERWIAIEQQRTAIRSNWAERERIGITQMQLLQAERQSLRTLLEDAAQTDDEIDQRRSALFQEQQELEARDAALQQDLQIIADQLTVIQKQMPPPLQPLWKDHMAQLGQEDLALSDRLSTVLVLLDETVDFSKRIALHKSSMTFGDREILVTQIYLGLSHGWYISEDGRRVGSGRAFETGWRWHDASDDPRFDKSHLRETIRLVESGAARELVSLPVSLLKPRPNDR